MKTIVLTEPRQFDLTDTKEPEGLAPDHALVKVHRVGICGTDLHAYLGNQPFFSYPRILGHELGVERVYDTPHGGVVGVVAPSAENHAHCSPDGSCVFHLVSER